jgi:hypothetical protein
VQPAPSLDLDELEVLYRICHVDAGSIDSGLLERRVEQLPGWTDEGMSGPILLIARLLADEHHIRRLGPFAEHGLRRVHPKVAPATTGSGIPKLG